MRIIKNQFVNQNIPRVHITKIFKYNIHKLKNSI